MKEVNLISKVHTSKLIFLVLIVFSCFAFYTYQTIHKPESVHEDIGIESSEERPHFSVSWMGYVPSYDDQYPEYYICINNLVDSTLQMQIALEIKNQEDSAYFFVVDQYSAPPIGWTILPMALGQIDIDETYQFVYNKAYRDKPSSIPGGRLTETISLVVKAYYDAGYTNLYSQDDFTVTFNFLDYESAIWNIVYNDDFDDGTTQGWTYTQITYTALIGVSGTYYRTFPNSLRLYHYCSGGGGAAFKKTFTVGLVSEAYLICSIKSPIWHGLSNHGIKINGVTYFKCDIEPVDNSWYQFTIPLKIGETNIVEIFVLGGPTPEGYFYAYLDDVYVIIKP